MPDWDTKSKDYLLSLGFSKYKKNKYVMVNSDILYYLSFEGKKKNIYIWYVFHPLSLPELWPSEGWPDAAGGIPHNELSIESDDDIPVIQQCLKDHLTKSLPTLLKKAENLIGLSEMYNLEKLPKGNYPKLICYLSAKKYEQAKVINKWLIDNYNEHPQGDDVKEVLDSLLKLENNEEIEQWLNMKKEQNIRKLNLVRLFKKIDNKTIKKDV